MFIIQVEAEKRVTRWTESVRVAKYSDSDLPESPESSPDEDFGSKNNVDGQEKNLYVSRNYKKATSFFLV